ncbi:hypothetical protein HDU98_006735 [Podochytrium sp. JEL0797]|nr:hypothetical protein HDU98_006735 [Podochytrium sp. JEL0797]
MAFFRPTPPPTLRTLFPALSLHNPRVFCVPAALSASRLRLFGTTSLTHRAAITSPLPASFALHGRPLASTSLGLRTFATAQNPSSNAPPTSKINQLVREYGPVALMVYAFFSTLTFVSCLTSIYVLGVDRKTIMHWIHRAKEALGFKTNEKDEEEEEKAMEDAPKKSLFDFLPAGLKSEAVLTFGTNMLLAMVMTKMFLPVKLTLVGLLTPTVAKRLRSMGFDFSQKGAFGNAANTVRNNMKK